MLSLKDWLCDQQGLLTLGFIIMSEHSHLVDLTLLAADIMIVSLNCWGVCYFSICSIFAALIVLFGDEHGCYNRIDPESCKPSVIFKHLKLSFGHAI